MSDGKWLASRIDFFLPVHALSKIFRAKFKHEMDKAGLLDKIPESVWQKDWNVNSQAVPTQEHCIEYLAPYVFRVAISNSRIVKVEDRRVFFKYRKKGARRMRTTSLDVMEFMHRFLQHVLPSGFMKVRYYGFLHPGCSISLDEIADMIREACGLTIADAEAPSSVPTTPVCPVCGGTIRASRPDKGLQGRHSAMYDIADRLWMIWKWVTIICRKTTDASGQDTCGLKKKRS